MCPKEGAPPLSAFDRLAQQVASAAQSIGQEQAKHLFREMRIAERVRVRKRRAEFRRRLQLGTAVLAADLDGWEVSEIVGMLLDAKDRVEGSTTMRLGLKKRGAGYLAGKERKSAAHAGQTNAEHTSGVIGGARVPSINEHQICQSTTP